MPVGLILTLVAGAASAGFYLGLLTGTFWALPLVYLAQLPLFAIGLTLGAAPAAIAASTGVLMVMAVGGVLLGLAYAVVNAAPAAFLVRQALLNRSRPNGGVEWYPPGQLLGWLCGLATGAFALAYALMLGSEGGLEGYFRDFVAKFLRTVRDAVESDASSLAAEVSLPAAETIAKFLPGAFAATWLGVTFANGALGQLLARISGRALRPSPEMADIELPTWVPGLAAIAAVGAMLPGDAGFVGVTVATILGLAFVFAGLAVVHARSRTWPQRRWWLGTIYLLSLTQGWPFLLVALLGVVEPWTNLRGRPAATPPGT